MEMASSALHCCGDFVDLRSWALIAKVLGICTALLLMNIRLWFITEMT